MMLQGSLVESEPVLEKDKLKALKAFLTNKGKTENEEFIREKFASKNIKCMFLFRFVKISDHPLVND